MKRTIAAFALLGLALTACGSEETQYQGVCTDPNTHVVLDPSNCSGGGSNGSDNGIIEYLLLSQFLQNQSAYSPGHTIVNNSTTHVYHSLPKNTTVDVRYPDGRAQEVTTSKTGAVAKSRTVKPDVFKKTITKVDKAKTQDLKKPNSVKGGNTYKAPSYKAPKSYSPPKSYRSK